MDDRYIYRVRAGEEAAVVVFVGVLIVVIGPGAVGFPFTFPCLASRRFVVLNPDPDPFRGQVCSFKLGSQSSYL